MGEEVEPEALNKTLGIQATSSHRKGDQKISSSGQEYAPFRAGLWAFQPIVAEEAILADHLEALLEVIEPHIEKLHTCLAEKIDWQADIFIGIFGEGGNLGFEIPVDLLDRLQRLRLKLDFDIYC